MTNWIFYFCVCLSTYTSSGRQKVNFRNHRVYRVLPTNSSQLLMLKQLEAHDFELNFWNSPFNSLHPVDIMVPANKDEEFLEMIRTVGINYQIFISDVQRLIDNERPDTQYSEGFDWNDYSSLEQIYTWLESLAEQFPDIVSIIEAGHSFEGRFITGVRLSYKENNPIIFVESGIHAREWISVATATFIINELLTSNNSSIRNIAENFDWYIVPCVNPDGYEFTFCTDRLWRKSRRPVSPQCTGTDLNRNWDYYWSDTGASTNPCSSTYAGSHAFSEVETRSLSHFLKSISDGILVYFAFHSYMQVLMVPFGLDYEYPDNYEELMKIGKKAVTALGKRFGTEYQTGTFHNALYPASGTSFDWVKKRLATRFTYLWELRDKGQYGFLLPASQIVPTAQETIDSIVVILEEVQKS